MSTVLTGFKTTKFMYETVYFLRNYPYIKSAKESGGWGQKNGLQTFSTIYADVGWVGQKKFLIVFSTEMVSL